MVTENIIQLFIKAANRHSKKPAFVEGEKRITYAELQKKVQSTAYLFAKKGISKGEKVLVFIPMKTDLYVTVLGLLYIGACPVFLDEWVGVSRLKECLKTVPCKAIIAERKLLFISWFIGPLRKLKKIVSGSTLSYSEVITPIETSAADTALITFTTGSTGIPKAANRTHRFLDAQQKALEPLLSNDLQITLTLLPIVVLLNLSQGKTNILPQKKLNIRKYSSVNYLLGLIRQHGVESIIASPAITVAIAKQLWQQHISTKVREVITGGGPLFPDEAKNIIQAFPAAHATVVFGSTEAEPISTINMKDLVNTNPGIMQTHGLPVGALHPDISVAIIPFTVAPILNQQNNEWNNLKLPSAQSGEIVVSGPHVLQAYINNETAQKQNKFFVENVLWHRTGDEGILDDLSNLYFRSRCIEVINYGGKIIYPVISTWLLKQKIAINEAAILLLNNELLVIIEKKNRVQEQAIIEAVKGTVLQNATIRFLPSVPKDKRHNTKIDYEKLRRLLR